MKGLLQKKTFICLECKTRTVRIFRIPHCLKCGRKMIRTATPREAAEDIIFNLFPNKAPIGWKIKSVLSRFFII